MLYRVSGWSSWKRLELPITLLADRVMADKLTKSLQQAFNPKVAGSFGSRPKLTGPVYHNNIVGTVKIHP